MQYPISLCVPVGRQDNKRHPLESALATIANFCLPFTLSRKEASRYVRLYNTPVSTRKSILSTRRACITKERLICDSMKRLQCNIFESANINLWGPQIFLTELIPYKTSLHCITDGTLNRRRKYHRYRLIWVVKCDILPLVPYCPLEPWDRKWYIKNVVYTDLQVTIYWNHFHILSTL